MMIMKIGTVASYAKRRLFLKCIEQMAPQNNKEQGISLQSCAHCQHMRRGVYEIVELIQ
jgi:hypothetical protein